MDNKTLLLVACGLVVALGTTVRAQRPSPQIGADGLVVMEAEDFHDNLPQGGHEWQFFDDIAGFAGRGFMRGMPDSGGGPNLPADYLGGSPRLDFRVDFKKTGIHYVWVRGYRTSGNDDSVHVGLNEDGTTSDRIQAGGTDFTWEWSIQRRESLGPATITVTSPGVHTVNVWMREDGWRFDKILLTTNANYTPTGFGPSAKATEPTPANGETGVVSQLLTWEPGFTSQWCDVYLGTTPDLGPAELVAPRSTFNLYWHLPGLEPAATYYWKVDGIEADGVTVQEGDLWTFTAAPLTAWDAAPGDGAQFVDPCAVLTWSPGMGAISHEVYFGTSEADVAAGGEGTFRGASPITSLEVEPLDRGTTYYWRVDQVDAAGNKIEGEVWSFTVRPAIARTPSLVGWWKLEDEGSGTAVDYSGWDRDGTLEGDPQWVAGFDGEAIQVDGVDDYVDTGIVDDLAQWTVCCWVISPQAPAATSPTGPVHREKNYQFSWNHTDDTFRASAAIRVDTVWHAASLGSLDGNTWYHLAATYDGSALKSYVNGQLITTNPAAAGVPDAETATLKFGRHAAAAQFFAGTIDDVRLYDRALSVDEIAETMRGDPKLAWDPQPARGTTVDIRNATSLSWKAGEGAVEHDVYLGTDMAALKAANTDSPEYLGRQPGMSYSLAGLVEFGGGQYAWRIDEVTGDGTVNQGNVWTFTVPAFLLVDDFESYDDDIDAGTTVYLTWIDGYENQTTSYVGYPVAANGTFCETDNVHGGGQSMPYDYNNINAPFYAEAVRTWAVPQNWTVEDANVLTLWFHGAPPRFVQNGPDSFTVSASGVDIWDTADEFRYIYKRLNGNGSITAKVDSLVNTDPWAKVGVMIRNSLDPGAINAMAYVTADGRVGWQHRELTLGSSNSTRSDPGAVTPPHWVRLTREGNTITAEHSSDGVTWEPMVEVANPNEPSSLTFSLLSSVYIGLAVTSHNANATTVAEFSGVQTSGGVSGPWQVADIGVAQPGNDAERMYVKLEDSSGRSATVAHPDPEAVFINAWTPWYIPLTGFAPVNAAAIRKMTIGFGDDMAPQPGAHGFVLFDDIQVIRGIPAEAN